MNSRRLAKAISDSGYCSRRDAEKIILQNRVMVNDTLVQTPAFNVSDDDFVTVDGSAISKPEATRLWIYHKPVGLVTTHSDPQNRPTVFQSLPSGMPRVISVGRLDLNSEGLLLLTNSGEFARKLEMPSNKYKRIYKVRAFGEFEMKKLESITKGIRIDGENYNPVSIKLIKHSRNSWFEMVLCEGKNREIRKIFTHFGLTVNRLIRTSYGPWNLGELPVGEVKEVKV
ncbi:MAG: pseudouridine synthase [Pseudomonadota bacterium]